MKIWIVLVFTLAVSVSAGAQSLGDVAHKADAARAAKVAAGRTVPRAHTYTDADLAAEPPGRVEVERVPMPVIDAPPTVTVSDVAAWEDRMRPLVDQLSRDGAELSAATARLTAATQARTQSRVDVRGRVFVSPYARVDVVFATHDASQLLAAVQADQAALARLREEARRAGVVR